MFQITNKASFFLAKGAIWRQTSGGYTGPFWGNYLGLFTQPVDYNADIDWTAFVEPTFPGYTRLQQTWGSTWYNEPKDVRRVLASTTVFQMLDDSQPTTVLGLWLATTPSGLGIVNAVEIWDTPYSLLRAEDALSLKLSLAFVNGALQMQSELL